ncbi:MAG TPA: alpha-amylase family glycosyl hydrolase [Verrucomicrobiae bacterium]|nr:alpha-amylase family glycosyl hydrolase [Verrucomicrobiae bacterium]
MPVLLVLLYGFFAVNSSAQSSRTGMGAIPYSGTGGSGVMFRVWAPDATSVTVEGDFNGWSGTANPLVKESATTGLWSADVPAALNGSQYKYKLNGSLVKMDPRSRKVVSSAGNSIVYDPNAFNWGGDTRLPVTVSNLVIYELHVGAFYDSTPASGGPGKFSDAITKLDYLASLGVGAVELMPVAEFPTDNSWGYNPSDVYAVENSGYGGPDGLKSFVKAAHQRGIRVLLDVVHNHYGSGDLDMYSFDTGTGPSIYFYTASGISTTPWGPRPNYSTDGVRSFIIDSFRMWMDECHVDGFRWDAVGAIRQYDNGSGTYIGIPDADSLLQYINSTVIHSDHPGAISIAEDDSGGMNFDSTWAVSYGDEVINEMTQSSDSSRSMANLKGSMDGSGFGRVLYSETHDLVGALNGSGAQRLPVRIQSSSPASYFARKRSMMAAAIVMTTPGIPQIFMGQERLETNQFADSSPLNWSLVTTYSSVWNFYHDMIRLRRNLDRVSPGLTGPNISWHVTDDTAKVLAYHRWGAAPNDQVMVVINCSNKPLTNYVVSGFPASGTWYVNLNTDWPIYGSDFENKGASQVQVSGGNGSITLGRYSVQVLSRLSLANTNAVAQFAGIQAVGTNFMLNWTGGQAYQQILLQSTNMAGPWMPVYTNAPPTAVTNSLSIPITGNGSSFFKIQTGP